MSKSKKISHPDKKPTCEGGEKLKADGAGSKKSEKSKPLDAKSSINLEEISDTPSASSSSLCQVDPSPGAALKKEVKLAAERLQAELDGYWRNMVYNKNDEDGNSSDDSTDSSVWSMFNSSESEAEMESEEEETTNAIDESIVRKIITTLSFQLASRNVTARIISLMDDDGYWKFPDKSDLPTSSQGSWKYFNECKKMVLEAGAASLGPVILRHTFDMVLTSVVIEVLKWFKGLPSSYKVKPAITLASKWMKEQDSKYSSLCRRLELGLNWSDAAKSIIMKLYRQESKSVDELHEVFGF